MLLTGIAQFVRIRPGHLKSRVEVLNTHNHVLCLHIVILTFSCRCSRSSVPSRKHMNSSAISISG